jgi:hypothetical protein
LKTKVHNILAKSLKTKQKLPVAESFRLVDYCLTLLTAIVEQPADMDPVPNYFYFSGYLSGILLGDKPVQPWPFHKVSALDFNSAGVLSLHVV